MTKFLNIARKKPVIFIAVIFTLITVIFPYSADICAETDDEDKEAILFNFDFESECEEWCPFDDVVLTYDKTLSYSGQTSLKASDRSNAYSGPSIDITKYVSFGKKYHVSLWIYHNRKSTDTLLLTMKYIFSDGKEEFDNIGVINNAAPGRWHHLGGNFSIPENVKEVTMYAESASSEPVLWIDDVIMSCLKTDGAYPHEDNSSVSEFNPDGTTVFGFESNRDDWTTYHCPKLVRSDTAASEGRYSMYVFDRTDCMDGISRDISALHRNTPYRCTISVTFMDKQLDSEEFTLQLNYYQNNVLYNIPVENKKIQRSSWSLIGSSSSFIIPENAENVSLSLTTVPPENEDKYTHISFYIDDVIISNFSEESKIQRKNKISRTVSAVLLCLAVFLIVIICILRFIKTRKAILSAKTDSMTGALNRNAYEELIEDLADNPEKCKKYHFAVCDLNGLKHINDELGHQAGDECIIRCAQLLLGVMKNTRGYVFRTGGDEFVCISHKPLRESIQSAVSQAKNDTFSVAVGFAEYSFYEDGETPDIKDIITRCDKEMYIDKHNSKA